MNYTWTKISRMLGLSRSTLYRRLEEYDIPKDDRTDISANQLDDIVKEIKTNFPNDGEVMLKGHVLSQGIKVSRSSLRAAIHRVDHENTVRRSSNVVNRRVYHAEQPNYVWHIDGMHKLIRWRLVIHAGVDGFSRTIVYMHAADNNRAATVLEQFLKGVSLFGLPTHVRSDHGGENVDVWRYMLNAHNCPTCVITGSSTHNERVERLWRDLGRSITSVFSSTFCLLESDGILDPLNEVDIFSLHFIFLPRLNRSLNEFQASWNLHALSTEGNMSPYQLFFEGLHAADADASQPPPSTNQVLLPIPNRIEVPSNVFVPCSNLLSQLQIFQPLAPSLDFGRDLYRQVVHYIGNHLQSGCNNCEVR